MTDNLNAIANMAAAAIHSSPSVLGVLIPVVAIVMGISMGMLALWLDYGMKRKIYQLYHAERMAAIEKGVEVPPLPPEFFQSNRRLSATPMHHLHRSLLLLFLGVSVIITQLASGGQAGFLQYCDQNTAGLLLIAAGIANTLFYVLDRRHNLAATTHTAAPSTKTSNDPKSTTHL